MGRFIRLIDSVAGHSGVVKDQDSIAIHDGFDNSSSGSRTFLVLTVDGVCKCFIFTFEEGEKGKPLLLKRDGLENMYHLYRIYSSNI